MASTVAVERPMPKTGGSEPSAHTGASSILVARRPSTITGLPSVTTSSLTVPKSPSPNPYRTTGMIRWSMRDGEVRLKASSDQHLSSRELFRTSGTSWRRARPSARKPAVTGGHRPAWTGAGCSCRRPNRSRCASPSSDLAFGHRPASRCSRLGRHSARLVQRRDRTVEVTGPNREAVRVAGGRRERGRRRRRGRAKRGPVPEFAVPSSPPIPHVERRDRDERVPGAPAHRGAGRHSPHLDRDGRGGQGCPLSQPVAAPHASV